MEALVEQQPESAVSSNSEAIKEQYSEKYKAMVAKLNSSVFLALKEVLVDDNMTFDENEVLKRFAQDTLQELVSGLDFAWEKSDIKHNLDHLADLKRKSEKSQRKSSQANDKECLGINIKMKYLLARKRKLEKYLTEGKDKVTIKNLMDKLELSNQMLREHNMLREKYIANMENSKSREVHNAHILDEMQNKIVGTE